MRLRGRTGLGRICAAVGGTLAAVAATLSAAQPAAAASALAPLPAETVKTYRLTIDPQADFSAYGAAVQGVLKSGAVTRATPLDVARSGQHTGRPGLCHDTGLSGTYTYDGFCWDTTDDNTSAYSEGGGWHPQGLTASHDATGDTVGGHHLYAASWYYGDKATGKNQYARVTFAESTGDAVSYGHVLLVKPTGNGTAGSFTPITNVHADGLTWYGNKLYVANGGELLVFDTQYLWRVSSLGGAVGVDHGTSSARWHQWALPLVARYVSDGAPADNPRACPGGSGPVCLGSLSLDRSSTPHALVSGEYRGHSAGAGGRVVRWPLNDATDLPLADSGATVGTTTARAAYTTPVFQMQGVATDGTWYYMAGECPTAYDPDPTDTGSYSCIHRARPGAAPSVLTRAPSLTQNLSYSRASGRLWGHNEWTGHRVVFSIDPP
ncbi:hypothetical protein ABT174_10460 [Streptomyces sparsogenes]|uniref:hypothetical protein n=1 Tax=Streptomyces sparsogenes TaxID=67365 RepID=UPI00332DAAC1